MLEPEAARLAAERATDADRAELAALLDELDGRRGRPRADRPRRADPPRRLPRARTTTFLEATLEQYYVLALRIWLIALDRARELGAAVEEHRALLEAISRGDGARAPPTRCARTSSTSRQAMRDVLLVDVIYRPMTDSPRCRERPRRRRSARGIVGNSARLSPRASSAGRDLVLLDKGPLPNPGGSTGHASNFIFPVDHSKEMTQLTLDSVRQYKEAGRLHGERRHRGRAHRGAACRSCGAGWRRRRRGASTAAGSSRRREVKELVPYIEESVIARRLLHAVGRHRRLAALRDDRARAGAGAEGAHGVREHRGARHRRRGRPRQARSARRAATSRPRRRRRAAACGARRSRAWPARRSR